ncbi:MAG: hypothetical protein IJM09_03430, partial [Neisseriaceae bacterium]|nr:hypothetical protein [Neisseriaceae bacterium]
VRGNLLTTKNNDAMQNSFRQPEKKTLIISINRYKTLLFTIRHSEQSFIKQLVEILHFTYEKFRMTRFVVFLMHHMMVVVHHM